MNEKILSLYKMAKQSDEPLPIDFAKHLRDVPIDVVVGYCNAITNHIEDLLIMRNIIASIDKPNTFQHLIDGLNEQQIEKLNKIALCLAVEDPFSKVKELVELTFDTSISTPESLSRADLFISQLKALDIDRKAVAQRLALFSRHVQLLSESFILLSMSLEFEGLLIDRLSKVSESDLNQLAEIASSGMVNNQ